VDIEQFKKEYLMKEMGIDSTYGKMLSMVDFGNVNYWFEEDRQDADNQVLLEGEKLEINLEGLKEFSSMLSEDTRFYYGHDQLNTTFIQRARYVFGKHRVITKQIQKVRHYLSDVEKTTNTRTMFADTQGKYVLIPKCNFDVEITVDSIRLLDKYDTLVLFTGDADFISLIRYLKKRGKKVILVKGGNITSDLRKEVSKVINAQNIKRNISRRKQKPGTRPGLANR